MKKMSIFWQECKHILRSRFLWGILIIGVFACAFFSASNWDYFREDFAISHEYVQKYGTSFTREDVQKYENYYLEHSKNFKNTKEYFQQAGLGEVTIQEILEAKQTGEPAEISEKLQKLREDNQEDYDNHMYQLEILNNLTAITESQTNAANTKKNLKAQISESLQEISFSQWKEDMLIEASSGLYRRVDEIVKNKENLQFFPLYHFSLVNSDWFEIQFGMTGFGLLWVVAFVLAGIIVGRSFGGSFMNHMSEMIYTGKPGRKIVLHKMASVLSVSTFIYVVIMLVLTAGYVIFLRLDLYWNIPLASMVSWDGPVIPRIPITVGGYWWFQFGVGLGATLIMALLFSTATLLTKSFYAGSAISIGFSLLLLGLIVKAPVEQTSLLIMGSPIGLFLNTDKFLQKEFLFSILPHFEGYSLLAWGGIAVIFAMLGFLRLRRTSL